MASETQKPPAMQNDFSLPTLSPERARDGGTAGKSDSSSASQTPPNLGSAIHVEPNLDEDVDARMRRDIIDQGVDPKTYRCLALLRSCSTPAMEDLETKAMLTKDSPRSAFLLRDIHWEKHRRKRHRDHWARKEKLGQRKNGMYPIEPVPVINVDPLDAAQHLQGRQVVGRRKVPLLVELNQWKEAEEAARAARKAAEEAEKIAREAERLELLASVDAEVAGIVATAGTAKLGEKPKTDGHVVVADEREESKDSGKRDETNPEGPDSNRQERSAPDTDVDKDFATAEKSKANARNALRRSQVRDSPDS